jgi:choline dehydrogenase-like flavoprotein
MPIFQKTVSKLRKAYGRLGGFLLPKSCTLGRPGGDIHYSGTMPMSSNPELGQTDQYGEVFGLKGVYAVDGASLPSLNAKPHTLTIMANADRIGHKISSK